MEIFENFIENIPLIEEKIGYQFENKDLLTQAFVHRSFLNEYRGHVKEHNERLEFLGDSVLGLLVADFLFRALPGHPEGELSRLRSQLVEATMCSVFTTKLEVSSFILLSKGERMNDGRGRHSILADFFEALMGAIYLDGGLDAASGFFLKMFRPELEAIIQEPGKNWKAKFQDWVQKHHQTTPFYRVISETGPDHSKVFHIAAMIGEEVIGEGRGASKKLAEQAAAESAMEKLENPEKTDG